MLTRTRVAFAVPTLARGGANRGQGGPEGVLATLLNTIDHDRFEVTLLVDTVAGSNLLDDIDRRVAVVPIAEHRRAFEPRAARRYPVVRFARALRELEPDVVLSTLRANVTGALAKPLLPARTALVARVANNVSGTLETQRRGSSPVKHFVVERLHRRVVDRADLLVAQSAAMADDLVRRFGERVQPRIRQIANPVDVDALLHRAAPDPPRPVPAGSPRLVSVGRLHRQKGYDLLFPAFAEVLARWPDAHLQILGEGPDRAELEALARSLDIAHRVDLPGFVADPAPFVARSDLYVCSSRYEGFSNALAEALAVGTPCVAPDGPAAGGELVTDRNGILIPEAEPSALATAIDRALSTTFDRTAISDECRARFSPATIVGRYEEVLLEAVARCRSAEHVA